MSAVTLTDFFPNVNLEKIHHYVVALPLPTTPSPPVDQVILQKGSIQAHGLPIPPRYLRNTDHFDWLERGDLAAFPSTGISVNASRKQGR